MDIRCFLLTDTGRTVRSLRRYNSDNDKCELTGHYHNAIVALDVVDHVPASLSFRPEDVDLARPWPHACACGYVFTDADQWQEFNQSEYSGVDGDPAKMTTLRDAPAGAMWFARWLAGHHEGHEQRTLRAGQPHLMLMTPDGEWDIDSPSSNADGVGWSRTGEPPIVTARPSIKLAKYHGFLTAGVLSDC